MSVSHNKNPDCNNVAILDEDGEEDYEEDEDSVNTLYPYDANEDEDIEE